MPGDDFFERQNARFALQAGRARHAVGRQEHVELLITKAEYECLQMRRDLDAAFAVPLTDRAVNVEMAAPQHELAAAAVAPVPAAHTPPARKRAKAA